MLKKMLSKKKKGTLGCMIIGLLAALSIVTITSYKVQERQIYYIKKSMTNATILSLMAANVVDLYEYATNDAIIYDACDKVGDTYTSKYGACSSAEFNTGMKNAYTRAQNRFTKSFKVNAEVTNDAGGNVSFTSKKDPTKTYYKEIKVKKMIMYNVFNGNVYKYEGTGDAVLVGPKTNNYKAPTDDIISNSGLYVELYVKLAFLGKEFDMPIKQYVDMSS